MARNTHKYRLNNTPRSENFIIFVYNLYMNNATGQSLSSFVTVTNKLGDETIVVFGGDCESQCLNVTMTHFGYIDGESQCINVTILKMMW